MSHVDLGNDSLAEMAPELVGKGLDDARLYLARIDCRLVQVKTERGNMMTTADFVPSRLRVETVDGVITRIAGRG